MSDLHIPVTFIIFNRPDVTRQAFECIRRAQPKKLYIVSDAAKPGDEVCALKVAQCRRLVEEGVDWPCEVNRIYATENMGCRDRVSSGITEVLSREEYTIILEDDILPAPVFFPYCQEMLEYYKDDPRVMMVSGVNLMKDYPLEKPYTFSCFSGIWGWATWARAWKNYDVKVSNWPEVKKNGRLKRVMKGFPYLVLSREVDSVYTGKKDTWDIQWDYCRNTHRGLGIVPAANLINNIGFGEDATHTTWEKRDDFSYGEMTLPIVNDQPVCRDTGYDRHYIRRRYGTGRVKDFVMKRLKKLMGKG